jgi:flagellar L-ring protein precursor FlgH
MNRLIVCAGLVVVAAMSGPAGAGSIWEKAGAQAKSLTSDDVARDVGDVLTIVINEDSKIKNETTRLMDKKSDASGKTSGTFDPGGKTIGNNILNFPKLDFTSSAANKLDGKANYGSDRSVVDQITVTVEDVLPNGNLVVLGKREREVAGDRQVITVSGIVRVSDIKFANSVSSGQVADFHIVYTSKGQENLFTNPGWLAEILNFLNPF